MLEWVHELDCGLSRVNSALKSWEGVNSLCVNLDTLYLSFSLKGIILSDSSLESLSALTLTHVLDSDVDSLGDDLASDLLVNDDTNGMLGNIKNSSSLSVIEFVGHALVNTTVGNDINVITLLVGSKDLCKAKWAVGSE